MSIIAGVMHSFHDMNLFFIEAAHSHNNARAQIIASLFGKIECRQLVREMLCNRCVHASHFYVLSHKK